VVTQLAFAGACAESSLQAYGRSVPRPSEIGWLPSRSQSLHKVPGKVPSSLDLYSTHLSSSFPVCTTEQRLSSPVLQHVVVRTPKRSGEVLHTPTAGTTPDRERHRPNRSASRLSRTCHARGYSPDARTHNTRQAWHDPKLRLVASRVGTPGANHSLPHAMPPAWFQTQYYGQ